MSLFDAILVPLDGSATAARSLGVATWLARRLGARLHVLSATADPLPAREALARLHVPEEAWPLVVLHQAPAFPAEAILEAVARHDVGLLAMSARGASDEARPADERTRVVGHVTQAVAEGSPVPVLLLPPEYREALPWARILVPVSGEAEADAALALAVRLADALDLEVHVAHVSNRHGREGDLAARARYADAMHHEYPGQLEAMVRGALPDCRPRECRRITEVALRCGDVTAELLDLIARDRPSLVVLGWHGRFATGHTGVVKRLIGALTCPVLLVKPAEPMPFRLRVGEEIE